MCLVLRPEDNKILSVWKKKILVHEECYAKFDSANGTNPLAHFVIPVIDLDNTKTEVENLETIREYKKKNNILTTSYPSKRCLIFRSTLNSTSRLQPPTHPK